LFLECARTLAVKTLHEGGANDWERITYVFRRCTARAPEPKEAGVLLVLLDKELQRFSSGTSDASELAFGGPNNPQTLPQDVSLYQLAAWTAISRVLLNLDETITKE